MDCEEGRAVGRTAGEEVSEDVWEAAGDDDEGFWNRDLTSNFGFDADLAAGVVDVVADDVDLPVVGVGAGGFPLSCCWGCCEGCTAGTLPKLFTTVSAVSLMDGLDAGGEATGGVSEPLSIEPNDTCEPEKMLRNASNTRQVRRNCLLRPTLPTLFRGMLTPLFMGTAWPPRALGLRE